jgi:hypothetical protein
MANKYLRKYLTPSAATETTIYTVPTANNAVVSSLRVTNDNASVANLTVTLYPEGGATPYRALKAYVLPTSQTMDVFSGVPLVLQAGDVLKVTSSVADVDFWLSYLEMDRT